jgi:hypothetical protein
VLHSAPTAPAAAAIGVAAAAAAAGLIVRVAAAGLAGGAVLVSVVVLAPVRRQVIINITCVQMGARVGASRRQG